MTDKNSFEYTYTAEERDEISKIREKYVPKSPVARSHGAESELAELISLDRAVTRRASTAAIALGTVGALVLGLGMSLVMTDLASELFWRLGVDRNVVGIIVGLSGMILTAAAYPTYRRTLAAERKKVAPRIIELSDRIVGE